LFVEKDGTLWTLKKGGNRDAIVLENEAKKEMIRFRGEGKRILREKKAAEKDEEY